MNSAYGCPRRGEAETASPSRDAPLDDNRSWKMVDSSPRLLRIVTTGAAGIPASGRRRCATARGRMRLPLVAAFDYGQGRNRVADTRIFSPVLGDNGPPFNMSLNTLLTLASVNARSLPSCQVRSRSEKSPRAMLLRRNEIGMRATRGPRRGARDSGSILHMTYPSKSPGFKDPSSVRSVSSAKSRTINEMAHVDAGV